jgi:hypothetical protein
MRNYVMDTEATITDISEKYNYAAVVFEAYNPIKGQVRYQMVLMRLDRFDSAYVGMCVKTDAFQLQPNDELNQYYIDTDKSNYAFDTIPKELD